jgi:hypothetical protein
MADLRTRHDGVSAPASTLMEENEHLRQEVAKLEKLLHETSAISASDAAAERIDLREQRDALAIRVNELENLKAALERAPAPCITFGILSEIHAERDRQEKLREEGRFTHTCASPDLPDATKLAILVEEVGEAARAVIEKGRHANDVHGVELRKELIQVAAVAVAWSEALTPEADHG